MVLEALYAFHQHPQLGMANSSSSSSIPRFGRSTAAAAAGDRNKKQLKVEPPKPRLEPSPRKFLAANAARRVSPGLAPPPPRLPRSSSYGSVDDRPSTTTTPATPGHQRSLSFQKPGTPQERTLAPAANLQHSRSVGKLQPAAPILSSPRPEESPKRERSRKVLVKKNRLDTGSSSKSSIPAAVSRNGSAVSLPVGPSYQQENVSASAIRRGSESAAVDVNKTKRLSRTTFQESKISMHQVLRDGPSHVSSPSQHSLATPATPASPPQRSPSIRSPALVPSPQINEPSAPTTSSLAVRRGLSTRIPSRGSRELSTPLGLGLSIPRTGSTGLPTPPASRNRNRTPATPPIPSPGPRPTPSPLSRTQPSPAPSLPLSARSQQSFDRLHTPVSARSPVSAIPKPTVTSRGRAVSDGNDRAATPRVLRKGPTAGTGYEGYGAFGKASRGRTSSVGNPTPSAPGTRSRSGSQSSVTSARKRTGSTSSQVDQADGYFLQRLKPVVISGGGVVQNQNKPSEFTATPMNRTHSSESSASATTATTIASSISSTDTSRRTGGFFSTTPKPPKPIPSPISTGPTKVPPTPSPVHSLTSIPSRKPSADSQLSVTTTSSKRWNFFSRSKPTPAPTPSPAPEPREAGRAQRSRIPQAQDLSIQVLQKELNDLPERPNECRIRPMGPGHHGLRKQQAMYFHQRPLLSPEPDEPVLQPAPRLRPEPRDDGESIRERLRKARVEGRENKQREAERKASAASAASHTSTERKLSRPSLPKLHTFSSLGSSKELRTAPPRSNPAFTFEKPVSRLQRVSWNKNMLAPKHKHQHSGSFDPLDVSGTRPSALPTPAVTPSPITPPAPVSPPVVPSPIITPDTFKAPEVRKDSAVSMEQIAAQEEEIWNEYDDITENFGCLDEFPMPPPVVRAATYTLFPKVNAEQIRMQTPRLTIIPKGPESPILPARVDEKELPELPRMIRI